MSSSKKLSLLSAIFINLNVMIGAGLFINTYVLSQTAGAASFLLYPTIGLLMLPLIAILGKLLSHYPAGGFYTFAASYSPFLGFLSCWSYFFAKLSSCAVMLFTATRVFQQIMPGAQHVNTVTMCLLILTFFTIINLQNMKVGIVAQTFFLTAKSIPILFVIIVGIMLFDTSTITSHAFIWQGMPINISLILYCLSGFETACSLSRNIENSTVNAPKAVYYSFGIVILLYGIFQGLTYMITHTSLSSLSSYNEIFPCITHQFFSSDIIANKVSILLNLAIGISCLGGAYGVLFSNSWNLYTLAEHNHIPGSSKILKLNLHHTPYISVLAEAAICAMFIVCNQTSQLALQRTTALGVVVSYTISAFSYFILLKKIGGSTKDFIISCAAFVTCTIFIISCIVNFLETGLAPLCLFSAILAIGSIMFMYQHKIKSTQAFYK